MIDLNSLMRRNSFGDMGALKTTIQKFYRVNGGSTQINGVTSDIFLPDRMSYIDIGERDMKNALPWDKIEPANYKKLNNDFSTIIQSSNERIKLNPQFLLIDENAKLISERQKQDIEKLKYSDYKSIQQASEEKVSRFKEINKYNNNLSFTSLPYELEVLQIDTTYKSRIEDWHKQLEKDVYVEEAVNVLHDLSVNNQQQEKNKKTKETKSKKFLGIF